MDNLGKLMSLHNDNTTFSRYTVVRIAGKYNVIYTSGHKNPTTTQIYIWRQPAERDRKSNERM